MLQFCVVLQLSMRASEMERSACLAWQPSCSRRAKLRWLRCSIMECASRFRSNENLRPVTATCILMDRSALVKLGPSLRMLFVERADPYLFGTVV